MARVGIVSGSPTQFDAPFFRYVAEHHPGSLHVLYVDRDRMGNTFFDAELASDVSWGIDLIGGYSHAVLPATRRLRWHFEQLRGARCDLLIVNGYRGGWPLLAAIVGRALKMPVALRLDSVLFGDAGRAKRLARRALFVLWKRLFQHFFAVGLASVDYLEWAGVARERISLFPYPADLDHFRREAQLDDGERRAGRERWGLPTDGPVVLSVAKFNQREAPWDLLRAVAEMDDPGFHLWLVGDGPERAALERFARDNALGNVSFGGYVRYRDLPRVYGVADVFVHPARYEPWGVSVQEALAAGLPVIASSRVGAARDFVIRGVNGDVYAAGDAADLRRKLEAALRSLGHGDLAAENARALGPAEYPAIWADVAEVARGFAE
jgi:glycosyltransferase involved in cell wall biosynthesis